MYSPYKKKTFANGMGNSYSRVFPVQLAGRIEIDQYQIIIDSINDTALSYWPCCYCCMMGYLLIPCTCGLSLLCPRVCVNDAKDAVEDLIASFNKEKLSTLGLTMKLEFGKCMSWVYA
jgi:hypothetical protein